MTNDFTGFSFDNIHSSALNIVRVSDGDRYSESLHPEFEDRRTSAPGRDGEYYYGSDYQTKIIPIKIAFDSMSEKQFRVMSYLFSSKKLCPLIFDERPYKKYMAKINSPIEIEYVCFDEYTHINTIQGQGILDGSAVRQMEEGRETLVRRDIIRKETTGEKQRVYKGEAEIEFVCPYPFARAPFKKLDLYKTPNVGEGNAVTSYETVNQWADASGILSTKDYENNYIDIPIWKSDNIRFKTYNPGDIDTPFFLYIPFSASGKIGGGTSFTDQFQVSINSRILVLNPITRKAENSKSKITDTGIMINTENHLIEGVDFDSIHSTWSTSGNIYNEYIVRGEFPKIPHKGPYTLISGTGLQASVLGITCYIPKSNVGNVRLFYDYLYY